MPALHFASTPPSRLRCVFDDAVMSFAIDGRPTLGDIADMLSGPAMRRHGQPLSIDIAWPEVTERTRAFV